MLTCLISRKLAKGKPGYVAKTNEQLEKEARARKP